MKYLIGFILLFIPAFLLAQAKLRLSLACCRGNTSVKGDNQVRIYKAGSLLHNIDFRNVFPDTLLKDLDTGLYRLEYTTIFNRLVSQEIFVTDKELNYERLCLDDYNPALETFKGFISSLSDNEKMVLRFESYGCSHWEAQDIMISRKQGIYAATLYPEMLVRKNKQRGRRLTRILTDKDIELLKNYESFILAKTHGTPRQY
jgi:hypothetical protein